MGVETRWRRAVVVFRLASLGYPIVVFGVKFDELAHPVAAVALLTLMAGWTIGVSVAYDRLGWTAILLYADLAATVAMFAASRLAFAYATVSAVSPGPWLGGAVLAWAVAGGPWRGGVAAVCVATVGAIAREGWTENSITETALLLGAGIVVGQLTRMAIDAEAQSRRTAERAAAVRERERLARGIHDSVLQVLALVQRRGTELGGEAAELGRLAGEQETALRSLIGSASYRRPLADRCDLRDLLGEHAGDRVRLVTPATPVLLPAHAAAELAAAVSSALDNVAAHCPTGTNAWVVVEEDGDQVMVTVRDDGPGMAAGRLSEAAADGRLGVTQSIIGRVDDLGGTVHIDSAPGEGTEVELCVPRAGRTDSAAGRLNGTLR